MRSAKTCLMTLILFGCATASLPSRARMEVQECVTAARDEEMLGHWFSAANLWQIAEEKLVRINDWEAAGLAGVRYAHAMSMAGHAEAARASLRTFIDDAIWPARIHDEARFELARIDVSVNDLAEALTLLDERTFSPSNSALAGAANVLHARIDEIQSDWTAMLAHADLALKADGLELHERANAMRLRSEANLKQGYRNAANADLRIALELDSTLGRQKFIVQDICMLASIPDLPDHDTLQARCNLLSRHDQDRGG